MNHPSQVFIIIASGGQPPNYERIKEEYEVAELGAPHGLSSVRTTVIYKPREVSVPDHVVWSGPRQYTLHELLLPRGFTAYDYSVKSMDRKMVSNVTGAQAYAPATKCLIISTLVLRLIMVVITIVAVIVIALIAHHLET